MSQDLFVQKYYYLQVANTNRPINRLDGIVELEPSKKGKT